MKASDAKNRIIVYLSIIISVVAVIIVYSVNKVRESEKEKKRLEVQQGMRAFGQEIDKYKNLIQQAIHVEYVKTERGLIFFRIENKMNIGLRSVGIGITFKDDFGQKLQFEQYKIEYTATSLEEAINPDSSIIAAFDLRYLSQNVSFDFYRYHNNITYEPHIRYFTLTNALVPTDVVWADVNVIYNENLSPSDNLQVAEEMTAQMNRLLDIEQ